MTLVPWMVPKSIMSDHVSSHACENIFILMRGDTLAEPNKTCFLPPCYH